MLYQFITCLFVWSVLFENKLFGSHQITELICIFVLLKNLETICSRSYFVDLSKIYSEFLKNKIFMDCQLNNNNKKNEIVLNVVNFCVVWHLN